MIPNAIEVVVQCLKEAYSDYSSYVSFTTENEQTDVMRQTARIAQPTPILVRVGYMGFSKGVAGRAYNELDRETVGGSVSLRFQVEYTRRHNLAYDAHDMLLFISDLLQVIRNNMWQPETDPADPTRPQETITRDRWAVDPQMHGAPTPVSPLFDMDNKLVATVDTSLIVSWTGRHWAPPSLPLPTEPVEPDVDGIIILDEEGNEYARAP